MNCPYCSREINLSRGAPAFCPWCGQGLKADTPSRLSELLKAADREEDLVKKRETLIKARSEFPDNIEIEKRLLFIGRMYERGGKPDFYRIPFWPLNALEKPKEFSKKERARMLESFFENPELEKVAELSDDREAFLDEYLEKMATGYIEMFIKGATSNNNLLIFRRSQKSRLESCANCLDNMLTSLEASKDVPCDMKPRLKAALIRGFGNVFGEENAERFKT